MLAPAELEPSLVDFVRALPKTETHLHFEGALPLELLRQVRPGTLVELARNGFEVALLPPAVKQAIMGELDALQARLPSV